MEPNPRMREVAMWVVMIAVLGALMFSGVLDQQCAAGRNHSVQPRDGRINSSDGLRPTAVAHGRT